MVFDTLQLDSCMMLHDVSTHWNSTYNMLKFAIDYRKAINVIVRDLNMDLRKYELNVQEWKIVTQLWDLLMVSSHLLLFIQLL